MNALPKPVRGRPRKFTCASCAEAPRACPACLARRHADRLAYGRDYHRSYYRDVIKPSSEKLAAHQARSRKAEQKRRLARGCKPRQEEA